MDTKLKNNKKSLNWMGYLIVISILISISSILIYERSVRNEKANYLMILEVKKGEACDIVPNLAMYADDISGNLREESIESQVNYIKSQVELYKKGVVTAKVSEEDLLKSDEEIRQSVVDNFKQYVDNSLRNLKDISNVKFYYESKDNGKVYTNTNASSREEFEEEVTNNNIEDIYIKNNVYAGISKSLTHGDRIYKAYMNYQRSLNVGKVCFALIAISFASIFFVIILLSINKKRRTIEVKETFFSKLYWLLYTEVKVIVLFIITGVIDSLIRFTYEYSLGLLIGVPILAFAIYIVILDLIKLSSLKEEKKLLRNKSLIYKVLRYIKGDFITYLKGTKLIKSTFSKVIALMSIFTVVLISLNIIIYISINHRYYFDDVDGLIFGIIVILIIVLGNMYILKFGSSLNKIIIGSRNISKGMYEENIDVKGSIILSELADNIENMQSGLKSAVDKAVKSEKMKGELITNVSHDLKTPLTSIINYVDLLEQENISEEDREKYIKVLKEKSNRLKLLIEDLFEVSKASSGSMELNMDNIDVVSLLTQTLVELEDKIEASGLRFIKSFPNEKIIIYADGRKLFRVFQNLLSNIFKYAMKNSRVYIEVNDSSDYVEVVFKNISEYELNFTEEEILQRFKRGDESRTTEGSGLGLSIAKSLVELQKGKFDICIDGDLFKVNVRLVKNSN